MDTYMISITLTNGVEMSVDFVDAENESAAVRIAERSFYDNWKFQKRYGYGWFYKGIPVESIDAQRIEHTFSKNQMKGAQNDWAKGI